MTAILDRIQSVRNKLDSFENIDQAQDYISTLSSDDYFALKILLKSWTVWIWESLKRTHHLQFQQIKYGLNK